MSIFAAHIRKASWICILLLALLHVGCAGIQPYNPRDYREEGLERGLLTGSQGEWVILMPKDLHKDSEEKNKGEQKTESERLQKEQPKKSADDYQ